MNNYRPPEAFQFSKERAMKKYLILFAFAFVILSCQQAPELIIVGEAEVVNGAKVYPAAPDFAFVDQDSNLVTNRTLEGKIYVTDFFFTHCPTICPRMSKQMLRMYKKYEGDDRVAFVSHSIDPKRDTVDRLKWYADHLGVSSSQWHFLTGDKTTTYDVAEKYYSVRPSEDKDPDSGGFTHDAAFILIDTDRHIRGTYDADGHPKARFNGTDPKDVDMLMKCMDQLLAEQFPKKKGE